MGGGLYPLLDLWLEKVRVVVGVVGECGRGSGRLPGEWGRAAGFHHGWFGHGCVMFSEWSAGRGGERRSKKRSNGREQVLKYMSVA